MSPVGRGIVFRQLDRLFGDGTLTGLGDGQLLDRYLAHRDEDAFAALVDLHGPMVLGLCRRMLRDPRDIEDAFQATFLVLVRKAPAIRDRNLLSNWLYGVAYRVARRARSRTLRHRDRESTVGELEVAAEPEPEPSDWAELAPVLDQELSRLPEKYRVPMVLCYLRGQTHDQAAEEIRCPVGTVRSRLARGRELLRKRLTRRGFAPSAMGAWLGGDVTLPARLLVATVPPPLAAATVRAALGFGSASLVKAGAMAASSLTLANGVLTTMKLTQIKWIGLAAMATCLSAGGVVAVGSAAAQKQAVDKQQAAKVADAKVDALAKDNALKTTEIANLNDRMRQLVEERDRLNGLVREWRDRAERDARIARDQDPRELETQLKLDLEAYHRVDLQFRRGGVSFDEREHARGKVLVAAARLEGLDDEIADEIERLKLELNRKNKERDKDHAEEEVAMTVVARNRRLNERKPKMVAIEEEAKAELQMKAAHAQTGIRDAEIAEVTLRIQQLERRRNRLKQTMALADQARNDAVK